MTRDVVARLRERLAADARAHVAADAARWSLIGAVVGLALAVVSASSGLSAGARVGAAVGPVLVAGVFGYVRATRAWSAAAAAEALERRYPADNLVVTAEALSRRPAHPWLLQVADAAWSRVQAAPPASGRAAWTRTVAAAVVTLLAVAVPIGPGAARRGSATEAHGAAEPRITVFTVAVTPPPYLGGDAVVHTEPTAVDVVAGSQVRLRAETTARTMRFVRDGGSPLVVGAINGTVEISLPSPYAGTWLVTPDGLETGRGARLLSVRLVEDAPPAVRVVEPGRDRRQSLPLTDLLVTLDARDDHALKDLRLRFTTVSGSGESFTFRDRDVAARVTQSSPNAWRADAVLPLASLELTDGDVVVYRGVAADRRPGAAPVESEAFLVEIGALHGASDAGGGGEDVDPDQRQAISQQMVILKTERLHAQPRDRAPGRRLEESQGLAIEQRMVRAEFVFMMGGEVQDEVEEAAHAHDLVEGRLENEGQAALLGATRAMSRAEARLTAGDTAGALVAEREALRFLRLAFDRRRFLLRPVAERARIDPARRLQGTTPPGPSSAQPVPAPEPLAGWDAVQSAAAALARARADGRVDLVVAAARLSALDSADTAVAAAAGALVRAATPQERRAALDAAQRIVHVVAARRLAPAAGVAPERAVSGPVADAIRRRGRR